MIAHCRIEDAIVRAPVGEFFPLIDEAEQIDPVRLIRCVVFVFF
jgi:hypothetical protein